MDEGPLQVTDSNNGKSIACPDYFDISVVSEVREVFQGLIKEKPATLTLNMEKIELIDTAAMQLLIAFINDAKSAGIEIKYQGENEAVCKAANTLGLLKHLEIECNNYSM